MSRKDELRAARAALDEVQETYQSLKAAPSPSEELQAARQRLAIVERDIRRLQASGPDLDRSEQQGFWAEASRLRAGIAAMEAGQDGREAKFEEATKGLKQAQAALRNLLAGEVREAEQAALPMLVKAAAGAFDVLDELDRQRGSLTGEYGVGTGAGKFDEWRAALDVLSTALGQPPRLSPSARASQEGMRKLAEEHAAKERAVNEAAERAHLEAVSRASGAGEKARRFARERLKELKA